MSTTTHNYPLPGLRTTATYLDFFFAYHFDLCDHDQRCQRIPVRHHHQHHNTHHYDHHHGSLPGSNIPPHSLFWNPIFTKTIPATTTNTTTTTICAANPLNPTLAPEPHKNDLLDHDHCNLWTTPGYIDTM